LKTVSQLLPGWVVDNDNNFTEEFGSDGNEATNLYCGTSSLNVGLNIGCPGVFMGFLQEYSWIVPQISPRPFYSTSSLIYYSLIFPSFDVIDNTIK
jgi:hypothetical protein